MIQRIALLTGILFANFMALAQTPVTVSGVTDRQVATDIVSFWVPATPGYTYDVRFNGLKVPTDVTNVVTKMDYHEIVVWRTNIFTGAVTNRVVQFVIQSSQRGDPERGLIAWVPYAPINSTAAELSGARMKVIAPSAYPQQLPIPVVVWLEDSDGNERRVNGFVNAPGFEATPVQIRRGVGSGFLTPQNSGGTLSYDASIQTLATNKQIAIDPVTTWTTRNGVLAGSEVWPANSRVFIDSNLTIPAGLTLTIGAGTIVKLNPLVNITNTGQLVINGTISDPVIFTATNVVVPENNAGAWGGFVMRGAGSVLNANGAIFAGGGGALSWNFGSGSSHKSQQPVIFIHSNAVANLTNCAVLNSAGQMGNGYNSDLTLDHTLWQRAITGGEYVLGTIIVNHSAIIEFPNDDGFVNATIADADYDAIYFTEGTHILINSLVGFAKDDAMDSGSGGAGTVAVTNCWVESAQHEAHAWSGGGRVATSWDSVLINSGQGLECGWSTGNNSPLCYANRMLSLGNSIGARFGDNYPTIGSGLNGFLQPTNSIFIYNYRDVWGMTFRTDANGWYYRSNQMDIHDDFLSQPNPYHPSNSIWNPSADGWRLAHWMTTPPDAPVGIGIATRTNQFAMTNIFNGIPVRLSSFTTNAVTVGYEFVGAAGGTLSTGVVVFPAGETVRRIFPSGFNLGTETSVTVRLRNPVRGELTDRTNVVFTGTVPAPQISLAVASTQRDLPRVVEGVPLRLSAPAAHSISISYVFQNSAGTLASGNVTFAPGELIAWAPGGGINVTQQDLVRFTVANPVGAPLTGPTTVYFVRNEVAQQPPPLTTVASNAVWRYNDSGTNVGVAWKGFGYDDSNWPSGPAELGFGDNDEATPILRTNTVTKSTNTIAFYFRRAFVFTNNLSDFTNLTLTLLRDDGAVVYLNSNEVLRTAMPSGTITYTTLASAQGEDSVDVTNIAITNLVIGTNIIAAEVHQNATTSSDISFALELLANPKPLPTSQQHIRFGRFDGDLTLGWSDGSFVLEQANTVTGIWNQVTSPSPVIISPTNQQQYFRLRR